MTADGSIFTDAELRYLSEFRLGRMRPPHRRLTVHAVRLHAFGPPDNLRYAGNVVLVREGVRRP